MQNKKPLTAKKLLEFLLETEKQFDLSNVHIYYRYDRDSEEEVVYEVEEDLYDEDDNATLTSIMFYTNSEEI
jgi:uncharacterized FlaG/YvyC family protein